MEKGTLKNVEPVLEAELSKAVETNFEVNKQIIKQLIENDAEAVKAECVNFLYEIARRVSGAVDEQKKYVESVGKNTKYMNIINYAKKINEFATETNTDILNIKSDELVITTDDKTLKSSVRNMIGLDKKDLDLIFKPNKFVEVVTAENNDIAAGSQEIENYVNRIIPSESSEENLDEVVEKVAKIVITRARVKDLQQKCAKFYNEEVKTFNKEFKKVNELLEVEMSEFEAHRELYVEYVKALKACKIVKNEKNNVVGYKIEPINIDDALYEKPTTAGKYQEKTRQLNLTKGLLTAKKQKLEQNLSLIKDEKFNVLKFDSVNIATLIEGEIETIDEKLGSLDLVSSNLEQISESNLNFGKLPLIYNAEQLGNIITKAKNVKSAEIALETPELKTAQNIINLKKKGISLSVDYKGYPEESKELDSLYDNEIPNALSVAEENYESMKNILEAYASHPENYDGLNKNFYETWKVFYDEILKANKYVTKANNLKDEIHTKLEEEYENIFESATQLKKSTIKKLIKQNSEISNFINEVAAENIKVNEYYNSINQKAGEIKGNLLKANEADIAKVKAKIENLKKQEYVYDKAYEITGIELTNTPWQFKSLYDRGNKLMENCTDEEKEVLEYVVSHIQKLSPDLRLKQICSELDSLYEIKDNGFNEVNKLNEENQELTKQLKQLAENTKDKKNKIELKTASGVVIKIAQNMEDRSNAHSRLVLANKITNDDSDDEQLQNVDEAFNKQKQAIANLSNVISAVSDQKFEDAKNEMPKEIQQINNGVTNLVKLDEQVENEQVKLFNAENHLKPNDEHDAKKENVDNEKLEEIKKRLGLVGNAQVQAKQEPLNIGPEIKPENNVEKDKTEEENLDKPSEMAGYVFYKNDEDGNNFGWREEVRDFEQWIKDNPEKAKDVTAVSVSDGIVKSNLLSAFENIDRVVLDKGVTEVQADAFNGLSNLKYVFFEEDVKKDAKGNSVCNINENAFNGVNKDVKVYFSRVNSGKNTWGVATPKVFMEEWYNNKTIEKVLEPEKEKNIKKEEKLDKELQNLAKKEVKKANKLALLPKTRKGSLLHWIARKPVQTALIVSGAGLIGFLGISSIFFPGALAAFGSTLGLVGGSIGFVALSTALIATGIKQLTKAFSKRYRKMFADAKIEKLSRKAIKEMRKADVSMQQVEKIKLDQIDTYQRSLKKEVNEKVAKRILKNKEKVFKKRSKYSNKHLGRIEGLLKKVENSANAREQLVAKINDNQRIKAKTGEIINNAVAAPKSYEQVKPYLNAMVEENNRLKEQRAAIIGASKKETKKGDVYKLYNADKKSALEERMKNLRSLSGLIEKRKKTELNENLVMPTVTNRKQVYNEETLDKGF